MARRTERQEHEVVLRRLVFPLLVALVVAAPAGAGTIVVSLTFQPGKLAVKAPSAELSPARAVQVQLAVADGRGSGSGWTLRSSVPVSVVSITARCAPSSTCTLPKTTTAPSGTVVLRAAHDTGMGVMSLVVTLAAGPAAPVSFSVR